MTHPEWAGFPIQNPETLFVEAARDLIRINDGDPGDEDNVYKLLFRLKSLNTDHYDLLHKAYTGYSTMSFLQTDVEMKVKAPGMMEGEREKFRTSCRKYLEEIKKTAGDKHPAILEKCNELLKLI